MSEDLAAEHRDAAKLAEIAGRALVELRADPPSLRDLGAAGDRMAHQLLVAEINRLYPDDDVRSEEGLEHVAGSGRLWIIDPLDGTREFRQIGPQRLGRPRGDGRGRRGRRRCRGPAGARHRARHRRPAGAAPAAPVRRRASWSRGADHPTSPTR